MDNYLDSDLVEDFRDIDTTPLDADDDFFDVLKEVLPVAAKWKAVGQALRLKLGELDNITAAHPQNPEKCLSEILTQWLRKNYNVKRFGVPTWQRLVQAVGDPAGGAYPALASQIAKKHRVKETRLKRNIAVRRSHSFSEGRKEVPLEEHYARSCEPDDLVRDIMGQPASLMREYLWYHGKASRDDSEKKLRNAPDGCFLIRESTTQPDSFALSLKHHGHVKHRIIHFREDSYTYEIKGSRRQFQKITELVKYYRHNYISTQGEILMTSCPQTVEPFQSQHQNFSSYDNHKLVNSSVPSSPVPPHHTVIRGRRSSTPPPALQETTAPSEVQAEQPLTKQPDSIPTPPPIRHSSPPQPDSIPTPPPTRHPSPPQPSPPSSPPSHTAMATEMQHTCNQPTSAVLLPQRKRAFQYQQCSSSEPSVLLEDMQAKPLENSEKFTCFIIGEGIEKAEVKSTASFQLHIPSDHSHSTTTTVSAELTHFLDRSVTKCTITQRGETEYEIAYKPEIRGRHVLTVRVGTHEIKGSPFTVRVHFPALKLGRSLRTVPGPSLPQLSQPLAIALSNSGSQIAVCESGKSCVSILSKGGRRIQEILLGGSPHGVACGSDRTLYIAITDLHHIQKFTHEGVFIKGIGGKGSNNTQFKKPQRVAVNDGLVYVCDSGNSRIQIFNAQLNFVSGFGQKGNTPGSLMSPVDIAFDSTGDIYVADSSRNRVVKFSFSHHYLNEFGNEKSSGCKLNCPQGVCVGANNLVYVTDYNCVSVFRTSGELLANFGGRGHGVGCFLHPIGIAVDEDGFVYVSDRDNNRIQVF